MINSFNNHQLVNLNTIATNGKDDQTEQEEESSSFIELQKKHQQLNSNQLNTSMSSSSSAKMNKQSLQMSNLAQLQLQFNNLEDQLLVKRKQQLQQQQQQQVLMLNSQQQQQQQRLMQIEAEIQKSYNFYTQMLKERKDYLINELNTIVNYAILNHTQNYNKQLKLKAELEQKRQSLEIAEAVQSALSSSDASKSMNGFNDCNYMRDTNNNKINTNISELNNLTMLNNQILAQLKANNPLQSIEFVSNYSAIQTSIRNTFGYIRINNLLNNNSTSNITNNNNNNNNNNINTNNSKLDQSNSNIYDYLTQINNQMQKSKQQDLQIDMDLVNLNKMNGWTNDGTFASDIQLANGLDHFGNLTNNNNQIINTFSASSSSSAKSTNSSASNMANNSSMYTNQLQQHKQLQQKPIGTIQHLEAYLSNSSPISITTADSTCSSSSQSLSSNSCLPSNSSNYFMDHFSKDWSNNTTLNNGIMSELAQKSQLTSNVAKKTMNDDLTDQMASMSSNNVDDLFNSTMLNNNSNRLMGSMAKSNWSSLVTENELNLVPNADSNYLTKDLFSPYFGTDAADTHHLHQLKHQQNNSPTLSALLNGTAGPNNMNSATMMLGNAKYNNNAITLSASSAKSTTSSACSTSHSFYANKQQHSNLTQDESNLILLSNNLSGQKLLSSSSSASASPDDRLSSLSSSASSTSSDSNYHDSSLATLKSCMKSSMSNTQLGQQQQQQQQMQSSSSNTNNGNNLAVGSSTRSQLRRSKMIYHCKFGEFGINDGQFTEPSGVTINTNNDIIVADTNSHRIQIFDKDGRFKFKFGECGKRDGQLLYPNRVSVVKHTGDIVVTERSPTHQIQIYNKYGQFLRKFGANILQHPRGVCVDNKGRIIVVECKVMRVLIFDLMGNVLQKFNCSKYLEFPNGVCCSSGPDREEIYISDNRAHCIKVFDYNGNFIRQIGGEGITNYPIGVGINSNNEILVADNHNNFNLTVFTQDGQLINALESKVKHAQCFDVGLMDDGSIVLASKDYRIYVYKYVNNNLSLSGSYSADGNLLSNDGIGNDFNMCDMNNDEPLYDLFSPQMSELTAYNQLIGQFSNLNGLGDGSGFIKSKSSDNLLDNMNQFNCLI